MPVICIGPVCIPISALAPIILFLFRPIYDRLPPQYQAKIDEFVKQCQLAINRCLKKIGWHKKKESKTNKNNDTCCNDHNSEQTKDKNKNSNNENKTWVSDSEGSNNEKNDTLILEMETNEQFADFISKNNDVIAYFTAKLYFSRFYLCFFLFVCFLFSHCAFSQNGNTCFFSRKIAT